jgi:hypothetical protein
MAVIYRPRHLERTVLYRVLFHYFDRFVAEYETRSYREYGYFRPIIFHPHLHLLITEGGPDEAVIFHQVERLDDGLIGELFTREFLSLLIGKELIHPELAQKLHTWRHTVFHVHSKVRAKTKEEAERVRKYMIRALLSLERLSFMEKEGKVVSPSCFLPFDGISLQGFQLFSFFS